MKIKKVNELNESKMFDDHFELLQHGERYLKDLYITKSSKWKSHFREILEDDLGYRATGYQINDLILLLDNEINTINNFLSDIHEHIKELNNIYAVNQKLSEADDKAYEDLDKLSDRLDKFLDQIEEYKKEIKSVSDSYLNIDDKLSFIRRYEWKLP